MYVVASVRGTDDLYYRGWIWTETMPSVAVHQETVGIHERVTVCPTLDDAKLRRIGAQIILRLNDDGSVESVWLPPAHKAELEERLSIWRTCYGGWPRYELNEEV